MRRFVLAIIVLATGGLLKALEYWSLAETILDKLRSQGPVGMLIVNLFTSPILHFLLIAGGLALAIKGIGEYRQAAVGVSHPTQDVLRVAPEDIIKLVSDDSMTSFQTGRILASYNGKRIQVSGTILDVAKRSYRHWEASIFYGDGRIIQMEFHRSWGSQLSTLNRHDYVAVVGYITGASMMGLSLDRCQLMDSARGTFASRRAAALLDHMPELKIVSPFHEDEVGLHETVRGHVYPPDQTLQVWVLANGRWHQQQPVTVNGDRWSVNCQFGTTRQSGGVYEVVATWGNDLPNKSYEHLPDNLQTSNFIRVHRREGKEREGT